jgi:hypothetical protein
MRCGSSLLWPQKRTLRSRSAKSGLGGEADCAVWLHGSRKPTRLPASPRLPLRPPEGGKVSGTGNKADEAKFSRLFKGPFSIGNVEVRSLPPQPGSCGVGETSSPTSRKAHNWRAFAVWWTVSRLPSSPNARPVCRKSPAATLDIPVFGRLAPETGFDRHWVAHVAVKLLQSPV